jgi:lysophospholipase L1-like esterase
VQTDKAFPAPKLTDYETDRLGYAAHIRKIHAAGKDKVTKGRVLQFGDSLTGALNYQLLTEAALGRYMVEARGRAGWTSSQGRTVITSDLKEVNPEFCLILYGTNNAKDQQAIEAAMADMLAIAKGCKDHGTVPIIATIPPRGFTDPYSKPEADYNAALIKTCRDHQIPLAYLFEALQAQPDRKKFLASDGVHWENQGFAIAGWAWKQAMDQVTFVLTDQPD